MRRCTLCLPQAGYHEAMPLEGPELRLLPLLVRSRLAQSLTLGACSVARDPGNAAYLMQTQRPGWTCMRLLAPGRLMGDAQMVELLTKGIV